MKKIFSFVLLIAVALGMTAPSASAAVTVTRAAGKNAYGQPVYSYTVMADGGHTYTATTAKYASATGGCTVRYYKNSRGQYRADVYTVYCSSAGTIKWTTDSLASYGCGETEEISQDGSLIYTDQFMPDCTGSYIIYSIDVTITSTSVTFYNPSPSDTLTKSVYLSWQPTTVTPGVTVASALCYGGSFGSSVYACWKVTATVAPLATEAAYS